MINHSNDEHENYVKLLGIQYSTKSHPQVIVIQLKRTVCPLYSKHVYNSSISILSSHTDVTADDCNDFYVRQRNSVGLSRPGTKPSPGEIETPGLHHMIA